MREVNLKVDQEVVVQMEEVTQMNIVLPEQ
jgi:hypothetical protein